MIIFPCRPPSLFRPRRRGGVEERFKERNLVSTEGKGNGEKKNNKIRRVKSKLVTFTIPSSFVIIIINEYIITSHRENRALQFLNIYVTLFDENEQGIFKVTIKEG
jgi:hypothetical protein